MADESSRVYASQVAAIIEGKSRDSTYVPAVPLELFITNRRQPRSLAELDELEREQLRCITAPDDPGEILAGKPVEDFPLDVEVAVVVDAQGTPRYRLWGGNFGWGYLMAADSLECIAFGAQHDLEHWNLAQRPIFWAMDRAWRRGGHGFQQPLSFCWWNEACWDQLKDAEPGTVQSEPYIRQVFRPRG